MSARLSRVTSTLLAPVLIAITQHAQTNSITYTFPPIYPATTVTHLYPSSTAALEVTLAYEHTAPDVDGFHRFPLPLSTSAALPATRQEVDQVPCSTHATSPQELAHFAGVLSATPCERQATFFDVQGRHEEPGQDERVAIETHAAAECEAGWDTAVGPYDA